MEKARKTLPAKNKVDDIERLTQAMKEGFSKSEAQIEKLAQLMAEGFADTAERFEKIDERFDRMDERFDRMDGRFIALESEVRNGFIVSERHLDRIETRIAALEFAVFGVDGATGRHTSIPWFERIEQLEKAVFKK